MLLKSLFTLAALSFGAVKAQDNNGGDTSTQSLAQIISTNSQTTQLFSILNQTYPSFISTLQGGNGSNATYTIFAPANSAFTDQVTALLTTTADVQDLIRYHVINGTVLSTNLTDGPNIVDTLVNNGSFSKWSNSSGLPIDIFKNSSSSSSSKKKRATTSSDDSSSTTSTAASSSPSSSTGIELLYGFYSANVIQTDIKGSNGVIHLIDKVLTFPQSPSLTLASTAGNGQVSDFQQAVNQTGLDSTFDGQNGITIFVPNNNAFSQTNLSGLTNDTLAHLLKYHAIGAVYYSTNLTGVQNPTNFTTLSGDNITITVSGNEITVGNSNTSGKVITSNILTDNGVIHIIDTVLFYPNNTNSSNNGSSNGNGSSSAASTSQLSTMALVLSAIAAICTLFL